MSVLLARTADRLYWGGRYLERAEDTARIVRAYNNLVVDYASATTSMLSWAPLVAVTGSMAIDGDRDPTDELTILEYLIADAANVGSIRSSVGYARENLRTTREVMPREAWQAVNSLSQYVNTNAQAAIERQTRDRFLNRVIEQSRQLDGVIESTMSRSSGWRMMRIGRLLERADMTTRVLGVAANGILLAERETASESVNDEVRWMSVLRSVSALQMYQRAVRGPIDGRLVIDFLVGNETFPRSVVACLNDASTVVRGLPGGDELVPEFERALTTVARIDLDDPEAEQLDAAMDRAQLAIANLDQAIVARYVSTRL